MSSDRSRRARPDLEVLETRLQLSATLPANSIGTSAGIVLQPVQSAQPPSPWPRRT